MTPWKHLPRLAIDSETTGPDPLTAKIVELGAVRFQDGAIAERRGMLLDPGCPIPAEASAIHGITDEDVCGRPTLEEVADRFLALVITSPVLIAYNWTYDAGILARELGERWDLAVHGKLIVDPLILVRTDGVGRFWKGQGRHKLSNVAQRFGIPVERGHRATDDCITTLRVLDRLLTHVPDDMDEARVFLETARRKQDDDFQAWRARQPPRESAA
jgi:DNA polymerase III subunit epsilon